MSSPAQLPTRKRLAAALIYELFAVATVAFFATVPAIALNRGAAIEAGNLAYLAWLLLVLGGYFVSAWVRGGQTIAAKAWRLRVVDTDGRPIGLGVACRRYLIALAGWLPLGLGHWWAWFRDDRRGWHDLACNTRLVYLPKAQ